MASAPSQPALPVLPSQREAKPPWRPLVSGVAGFLCGPIAAALIAFINLRRLNQRRKAVWTLALTVLGSVIFGLAISMATENVSSGVGKLIGHVVSPFLYPFLQQRAFGEWQNSNPGAKYDNDWRSSGWAILGLAAWFVIAIGAGFVGSWNDEVRDIEVRYRMPEKAAVGETVVFTITVHNTANRAQLLHSLDIETHFLEGISIEQTKPAFKKSEPNPLAPIMSYIFEQNIPAKGALKIELQGRTQKPGSFPLAVDICVKTAVTCSSYELRAITVQ
jgi:hypothetical protein